MSFWKSLIQGQKKTVPVEHSELIQDDVSRFTPFSGNAYESDIYRAAVDAIARNAAKLKPTHVITIQGQRNEGLSNLNRILQVRPNPYMNTYDLLYKLITHYYLYNNAFALLQRDASGRLTGIYPLRPLHMEYATDPTGTLYCKFLLAQGRELIVKFTDVLTLKRFFNSDELLGDKNTAIIPTVSLAHTQNEGMEHSIKSSGKIRGILKFSQILATDKLREERDAFIKDYLSVSNTGGVAVLDNKYEYIPLETKQALINEKDVIVVKQKIYDYLGISESIVNSTYNENEWAAFYESVIEPLALQISLELTEKIFTHREQAFGNSILMEANRLQFASNTTKTNILKELMPLGLFTINQALEILNLPSVEDGDRRVQTLNVASTDIVDSYQLNKAKQQKKIEGDEDVQ